MDCKCMKESVIATIQSEIKTLFKTTESNKSEIKDLKEVYKLIYELSTNVSVLTEQMVQMNRELSRIGKDVEVIKQEPINNYAHYKKLIIGAILTSIVGAFLAGKFL